MFAGVLPHETTKILSCTRFLHRASSAIDSGPVNVNFASMNVHLPDDLEKYVEDFVQTGHYPAYSDVIQEASRQHQVSRPDFGIVMTPELEKLLDGGWKTLIKRRQSRNSGCASDPS